MSHDHHHHGRGPNRAQNCRRLVCALALTVGYMAVEMAGAWWAGSLALAADAGHMFSDAAALGLSLAAMWIAQRPPNPQHSFGYYRAEILAALVNGALLLAMALAIVTEAVGRLGQPRPVLGGVMTAVAIGGLAVNLAGLALLSGGRRDSLNLHGAWLHLLGDALGSVAALAAGTAVWAYGWYWADPAASIAIALLVAWSSWGLVSEAVSILMESAPRHLDVDQLRNALAAVAGVREIHDLHVWSISGGLVSLSAHVLLEPGRSAGAALADLKQALHDRFGIDHVTIQIEPDDYHHCSTRC
jgi:cobalt-zinc-cadmium efflux system protein